MQGALPVPTGRRLGGDSPLARYWLYASAVVAVIIGLLILPAIFHALGAHEVRVSDPVPVLDVVWLILGVALSVFLVGSRGAMLKQLSGVVRARLEDLQRNSDPIAVGDDPTRSLAINTNLPLAGASTAARLFDIVFLLVIQAIIREPLVGVVSSWVPEAMVDGAYVVVIVLLALVLLMNVRSVSRPLLDYLLWLGLDTAVPTAGFGTSNASETFTRMTTTATTSRSGSGPRSTTSGRRSLAPVEAPTLAGPDALMPTMLAGSVEATVAAPPLQEATVVAPASEPEATVVDVPRKPSEAPDATRIGSNADETIVARSDETVGGKYGQKGRSEGER